MPAARWACRGIHRLAPVVVRRVLQNTTTRDWPLGICELAICKNQSCLLRCVLKVWALPFGCPNGAFFKDRNECSLSVE